jgi:hypothetical protein
MAASRAVLGPGSPLPHSYNASKLRTPCLTVRRSSSGEHTEKDTPVPIPNTVVKLFRPMIVPTSAKVGTARFFKNPVGISPRGFCFALRPNVCRGERASAPGRTSRPNRHQRIQCLRGTSAPLHPQCPTFLMPPTWATITLMMSGRSSAHADPTLFLNFVVTC